ncbi:immunity 52 family protein [Corallococcus sp. BB11-1]|uniref:immunity 52 family protein n=1 Tax=Corallococcus sp. BB11-1 TaxID=2996783 RepID=UPI00226D6180|nr:immunity 52 family protein [Corallococcus sp. BB11-1]MCY1029928.1 immunity 52 family protein [Corallococcus sp. BB11-1]
MSETYYTGCYWLARQEPVDACAQRMEALFRHMGPLEPTWNRWHQTAATFEKARKRQVQPDAATLKKLLGSKAHRFGDTFSFWLWAGENEDEISAVKGHCGSAVTHMSSVCILNTPSLGSVAERVLTAPVLTGVVRAMALAWEPEFGIATSHEHRERLVPEGFPFPGTFVGWVMYFADSRGPVPPLPAPVQVEHLSDRGTIITLTPERFTVSNPDHVALAADVQARLQDAGLLRRLRPWGT